MSDVATSDIRYFMQSISLDLFQNRSLRASQLARRQIWNGSKLSYLTLTQCLVEVTNCDQSHFAFYGGNAHSLVIIIVIIPPFFDGLLLPQFSSYRRQTNWKMSGLIPIEVLVAKLFDIPINFHDI